MLNASGEHDPGAVLYFNFTGGGGNEPAVVTWDFGDGNGTTGAGVVSHQYTMPGTYTVTCTRTDVDGDEATEELDDVNSGDGVACEGGIEGDGVTPRHSEGAAGCRRPVIRAFSILPGCPSSVVSETTAAFTASLVEKEYRGSAKDNDER
jgi:PKD repeat protein